MTHENYGKSNFYGRNIYIEIKHRRSDSKVPTQRCDALEKLQDFTSKKYDSVIETIQKPNSQAVKLDKKYKEVTDSLEQKHAELVRTTSKVSGQLAPKTIRPRQLATESTNLRMFLLFVFYNMFLLFTSYKRFSAVLKSKCFKISK